MEKTKITQQELDKKLAQHSLWLDSKQKEGEPFTAFDLDFSELSFAKYPTLIGGNLLKSRFHGADMRGVNLESINVSESDFRGADLRFANLKKCDFKYTEVDENTNFAGAKTEGMVVDTLVFAMLSMHDCIDLDKLEIYNRDSIDIVMRYRNENEKYVVQELGKTFTDFIEDKYKNVSASYINKGDKIIFTINATDEYEKYKINADKETFGLLLRGEANVNDLTESWAQQKMIEWKMQNLVLNYKVASELAEQRRLELQKERFDFAIAHNAKIDLLNEMIEDKKSIIDTFKEKLETFAFSQKQLQLQSPLHSFPITLLNEEQRNIVIDNVLFATKGLSTAKKEERTEEEDNTIYIYLKDEDEPVLCVGSIGDIAGNLLRNPNFLRCHKEYVINVKEITRPRNEGNNIIVRFKHNEKNYDLHVSQTHKRAFREMYERLKK